MKKVLVINSSARTFNSESRKLTDMFVEHWRNVHPQPNIRFRELGNADVPHVSSHWITAAFKPPATRSAEEAEVLRISDTYISELREADIIVIGSPMYNWSIPSSLKAYIDQILRVNETFKVTRDVYHPYTGLLEGKTLFLLLSSGHQGYEKGGHNEHMNFQSTYLTTVFNIIGISDIHVISVGGKFADGENFKRLVEKSGQRLRNWIEEALV